MYDFFIVMAKSTSWVSDWLIDYDMNLYFIKLSAKRIHALAYTYLGTCVCTQFGIGNYTVCVHIVLIILVIEAAEWLHLYLGNQNNVTEKGNSLVFPSFCLTKIFRFNILALLGL